MNKRNKNIQSNSSMIQNVKQEVHIHPSKMKLEKKVKKKKSDVKSKKEPQKKIKTKMKTIFEGKIIVEAGWFEKISFELNKGDRIKGIAYETDNEEFDCYIMNEAEYAKYLKKELFHGIKKYEDDPSIHIDVIIPEHDIWYIVFDLYGKQNDREINITLRKIS